MRSQKGHDDGISTHCKYSTTKPQTNLDNYIMSPYPHPSATSLPRPGAPTRPAPGPPWPISALSSSASGGGAAGTPGRTPSPAPVCKVGWVAWGGLVWGVHMEEGAETCSSSGCRQSNDASRLTGQECGGSSRSMADGGRAVQHLIHTGPAPTHHPSSRPYILSIQPHNPTPDTEDSHRPRSPRS